MPVVRNLKTGVVFGATDERWEYLSTCKRADDYALVEKAAAPPAEPEPRPAAKPRKAPRRRSTTRRK